MVRWTMSRMDGDFGVGRRTDGGRAVRASPAPRRSSAADPRVISTHVPDGRSTRPCRSRQRNPIVDRPWRGRAPAAPEWPWPIRSSATSAKRSAGGAINRGGEHGFFVEQTIPLGGKLGRSRPVFENEEAEIEATARDASPAGAEGRPSQLYYACCLPIAGLPMRAAGAADGVKPSDVSSQLANVGAADRPDRLETEIEAARSGLDLARGAATSATASSGSAWRQVGDPTAVAAAPRRRHRPTTLPEIDRDEACSGDSQWQSRSSRRAPAAGPKRRMRRSTGRNGRPRPT